MAGSVFILSGGENCYNSFCIAYTYVAMCCKVIMYNAFHTGLTCPDHQWKFMDPNLREYSKMDTLGPPIMWDVPHFRGQVSYHLVKCPGLTQGCRLRGVAL